MKTLEMAEQAEKWKILRSEEVANCRVFKVRRDLSIRQNDPDEERAFPFYVIEAPDWCNVIALTPEKKVVLIEQYRQGIESLTLEIPGGMIDEGEAASIAAERELLEETGYLPGKMIELGRSRPNPAIQNNWVYHFLAIDCEKVREAEFDSTEHVVTRLYDIDAVGGLIENGEITHSLVFAAFLRFWQHSKNATAN